jgi:putative tricarboxylic transport membrane protein
MTDPDPWLFVTRPISGILLAMSIASVAVALWQHRRATAKRASLGEEARQADADF